MQLRVIFSMLDRLVHCQSLAELDEIKTYGRSLLLDQQDKDILNPCFAERKLELTKETEPCQLPN